MKFFKFFRKECIVTVLVFLSVSLLMAGGKTEEPKQGGSSLPYEGVKLSVLAQRASGWEFIDQGLAEFEASTGMSVTIRYFEETERRTKSRMDAATGADAYDVYYVDEANLMEFVSTDWIIPLLDYYPSGYDYNDFFPWMRDVGSVEGVAYYAPTFGGGDFMFYRKDLLDAAGIKPPKTLDELMTIVKKVNNPPEIYGIVNRGLRGSGSNVWRWNDYFKAYGGEWQDKSGKVTFNSPAGVKATEFCLEMLNYAPPGTSTSTFSDNIEAFRSGKAMFFIDGDVFYSWMEDSEKSEIAGKVGYTAPPSPLPSGAYVHGLAISNKGAATDLERKAAGEFIGWATSKEMEMIRVNNGIVSNYGRSSTLNSSEMQSYYPDDVRQALIDRGKVTEVTFMRIPEWPEIGDYLGIVLEEIYTGTRSDIQEALDEAADYANELLGF